MSPINLRSSLSSLLSDTCCHCHLQNVCLQFMIQHKTMKMKMVISSTLFRALMAPSPPNYTWLQYPSNCTLLTAPCKVQQTAPLLNPTVKSKRARVPRESKQTPVYTYACMQYAWGSHIKSCHHIITSNGSLSSELGSNPISKIAFCSDDRSDPTLDIHIYTTISSITITSLDICSRILSSDYV